MSLLKTIGGAIVKIAEFVIGFGPRIEQAVPAIVPIVTGIQKWFTIIQDVEVMGQALTLKGPDKLKAAAPLIGQDVLKILDDLGYKVSADKQPQLAAVVTGYASVTADLLNIIETK